MFARYTLRTTDLAAATAFYARALGLSMAGDVGGGPPLEAWPLHEQARRAGAPPHWLGHLEVDALDSAVAHVVNHGGQPLGPTVRSDDGRTWATVRDPFGAVVALCPRTIPSGAVIGLAWHQLHTTDLESAWTLYASLAGWHAAGMINVPDPVGGHRLFAWAEGGGPIGSVANTARWPGVHPHWLFHFGVEDIDAALQRVRALGGRGSDPRTLPDDTRVAACEDPQGAAFGLLRRAL